MLFTFYLYELECSRLKSKVFKIEIKCVQGENLEHPNTNRSILSKNQIPLYFLIPLKDSTLMPVHH